MVFDRVLPERITDDDSQTQQGALSDLNMLVNLTGCERSEAEFDRLFEAAGFTLTSARNMSGDLGIVEVVPA